MRPLQRLDDDDAPALAMENELLRYEVLHLRGRVAAAEERQDRRDRESAERQAARASEMAELEEQARKAAAPGPAHDDLVWLLRRLEGTPAAVLLRRRSGYRRLVETYLRDDV